MPQCCADGCFSQQGTGKMLHRLPTDSVRRAEWVRRIGRKSWTPNNNCRLCEDHFTPDQYEQNRIDGLRKLKCNAVPSIFKYRCEESQNRDSLIGNMGSDTPCMESHIIPDASSSTNNDPSTESHIIPDAPCSVDFSRTKLPRPIPEHSIDIEKQELLGKIQLLRKKNYKVKAKIKQQEEDQSLYKLSGAVVRTVINRHRIRCETCKSALLKSTSCDISRVQVLTDLSNYSRPDTFDKNSGLIFCSELVYCFLQNAEFIFRKREEEILSGVVTFSEMLETLLPLCIKYKFPPCHSVGKHILKAYLFSRIHFIVRKFSNTIVRNKSSKCGSKRSLA
ncbi:uncharacterized protein [Temnothorax longispinosus]|uniref:uncharacterized protein isoform X2 n=1 Tax=Temnothorax longispinosus TaxID=300112 RepID=UPI003A98F1D3